MHIASLKSSRYDLPSGTDRFDRNYLFLEQARQYRNVLECGCSTGFLSKLMVANGSRVVGIEIDPDAAEQARQFCDRVLSLDLNDPNWTAGLGERFDLVTFGDVLEHLIDPQTTLRNTRKALIPGGRVLISLPNIAFWVMRVKLLLGRFEYQELGLLDYTHLRFFTVDTGRKMIENAGYRIVWFHPVFGGPLYQYFRPVWQWMANLFPNLLAVQMLFLIEPVDDLTLRTAQSTT